MIHSSRHDPIFGGPRHNNTTGWCIVLAMLLGIGCWYQFRPDAKEVIQQNQISAVQHLKELGTALRKWKRNDYDGNGRADLPLGPLSVLRETRLINGYALDLISDELAKADLRLEHKKSLKGYYFALVHLDQPWPAVGMVPQLAIFARPAVPGRTGSCYFYVDTQGEAYFSDCLLPDLVPPWPDAQQLEAKIWKPLPKGVWAVVE